MKGAQQRGGISPVEDHPAHEGRRRELRRLFRDHARTGGQPLPPGRALPGNVEPDLFIGQDGAGEILGPLQVTPEPERVLSQTTEEHHRPPVRLDHEGVLAAASLRGVDDQRALAQRDPGQPAARDVAVRAGEDEGPQIEVPWLDAPFTQGRRGRELDDWLGDEVARILLHRCPTGFQLFGRSLAPDHHAVAARFVRRLDHEASQVSEDVLSLTFVEKPEGRDIGEDGVLRPGSSG